MFRSFYLFLFLGSVAFNETNVPNFLADREITINSQMSTISFSWDPVLSKTNPVLSSIYLIVLHISSTDPPITKNKVLGLVSSKHSMCCFRFTLIYILLLLAI